jgi:hypothetical protein
VTFDKGESRLSSLCEYKPRENVQKGYLNGRYGTIPFFDELNNIHWELPLQKKSVIKIRDSVADFDDAFPVIKGVISGSR